MPAASTPPASLVIRPATPADAPALCAIWNPVIRDTLVTFTTVEHRPENLARTIAERAERGQAFLLAEADGAPAGFATWGPFRAGPGYAFTGEHTIILAEAARGRGIGRALMAALEEKARAAGLHALVGAVSAANPGALAFHAACGFTEAGRLREVGFKAGRWLDLVLVQKLL